MNDLISIFIDSDVFVAFVKKDDHHHEKVTQIFNTLKDRPVVFYTSNYVFSESVTVISKRIGRDTALGFIEHMKSDEDMFSIISVDEKLEEAAIQIFKKQRSKNVSLVDCVTMAIIKSQDMEMIFSFDETYRKNGLTMATDAA